MEAIAVSPRAAASGGAVPRCPTPAPWALPDLAALQAPDMHHAMAGALDALDQVMMLLGSSGALRLANRAAWRELERARCLQVRDGQVRCTHEADHGTLTAALRAADNGRRSLLVLHGGGGPLTLAVIPLTPANAAHADRHVLVLSSRERISGRLAVQMYARACGATPAETDVLQALCDGLSPRRIATLFGVSLSTVRTQIQCLRAKTGMPTVAELLRQMALLPPVTPVLE